MRAGRVLRSITKDPRVAPGRQLHQFLCACCHARSVNIATRTIAMTMKIAATTLGPLTGGRILQLPVYWDETVFPLPREFASVTVTATTDAGLADAVKGIVSVNWLP